MTEIHNVDVEVEQALLGAILVNNEAYHRASEFVLAEHFYEPIHRSIYETIEKFARAGKAADELTMPPHLPELVFDKLTMKNYLARLVIGATSVVNAPDYAKVIRDLAVRRSLSEIGGMIHSEAVNRISEFSPDEQIEEAEKLLHELAKRGRTQKGFQSFSSALAEAVTTIGEAYRRDGGLSGYATGFVDLDHLMGGLQKSDLIILAGRPAMGKTALATNIAFNIAKKFRPTLDGAGVAAMDGGRVAFFSLEMSAGQLAVRILSEQAGISSSDLRRGRIHESQFSRLVDVSREIEGAPLHINDRGGVSVHQLFAEARRLKRTKGLDVIVIDYLQLLSGSRRSSDS
ncbi:DnaB-like helicase C-terminal domain-containing protein, partial [Devosia sp.]|uniref:DnaB-like helicase C-terminal domain-containing protein n=1 Tax=Devosia sp. TaxID=1871048 RepID=UPI001AC5626B